MLKRRRESKKAQMRIREERRRPPGQQHTNTYIEVARGTRNSLLGPHHGYYAQQQQQHQHKGTQWIFEMQMQRTGKRKGVCLYAMNVIKDVCRPHSFMTSNDFQ